MFDSHKASGIEAIKAFHHHSRGIQPIGPATTISSVPFVLTFIAVAVFAWRTLFPLLSGTVSTRPSHELRLRNPPFRLSRLPSLLWAWLRSVLDHAAAIAFSTTISLSAVLAELIFCEISDVLDPAARSTALEITISALLVSLVVVIPAIEIHTITSAAGWRSSGLKKGTKVIAWTLDIVGLVAWLAAFWWIGKAVLGRHPFDSDSFEGHGWSEGSLERIGIIGISLMASLAGFAAVSSLWQTFGVKNRKVTDTDIARKQNGLEATADLLATKECRLRSLERKIAESPKDTSFMSRVVGSIRGNADTTELATLRLEISGLETMSQSLSSSLSILKSRHTAQTQATTPTGRLLLVTSYAFSLYCLARILTTSLTTIRRYLQPSSRPITASTDPITTSLALLAKHWDPTLDRAAWSRQIAFLLSGLMLLASFNAVLQTVLLFSRFTPASARKVLTSAQSNFALLVAQISGTYVVSSALLLRSNLPKEMGSVIEGALGAPLDTAFVERWFEGWFLGAVVVTGVGIVVGRKVVGTGDWEDDLLGEGDVEVGKLS